jgi:hypothetical protein
MTAIEHKEIKGVTLKNLYFTIIGTATIVASVLTTYFGLKGELTSFQADNNTTKQITELRLKTLETQVSLLQTEVENLKKGTK